ncbi:MAG: RsbRD N-terminal domain-containing protein [Caldimicrobium sp.]|nr:RsbRD N-terminal domain-containing protein [Caldimicrobium sp.]MCX7612672.1 RsbRD N-terminal domain-containing protein [Caldimicrobium sp.]MDW8182175.1 RsbRD N-terminal domain-containing protein [Caldimicrobium sp.]
MKLVLGEFFQDHKDDIFQRWIDLYWSKYGESKTYLKKGADPFQNPFAFHVEECFKGILDFLSEELNFSFIDPYLEKLAQLRATQEGSLSLALSFLIDLKALIREHWGEEIVQRYGINAILEFEDLLSALLLRVGDYYLKYRERIYDLKIEEWKRNHYLLLKRAGLLDQSYQEKHQ